MALDFEADDSDYLVVASPAVTGNGHTFSAWVKPETITGDDRFVVSVVNDGSAADSQHLYISSSGDVVAKSESQSASKGTVSTGSWQHIAARFSGNSSRIAYLDGVAGTENTSFTSVGSSQDYTYIGVRHDTAFFEDYYDGLIGEVAIWTDALDAAEITMLAAGASPLMISPATLAFYCPMLDKASPTIDIVGGLNLTWTNTPVAANDHPAMYYPSAPFISVSGGGAPPAANTRRYSLTLTGVG